MDEGEVGRRHRDVRAGAHRDAEIGGRERGGVVDAVADHADRPALALEPSDRVELVLRRDFGEDLRDADLGRDLVGDRCAVAGEQDRFEPELAQVRDRLLGRRLDRVGDGDRAANRAVPLDGDGRAWDEPADARIVARARVRSRRAPGGSGSRRPARARPGWRSRARPGVRTRAPGRPRRPSAHRHRRRAPDPPT